MARVHHREPVGVRQRQDRHRPVLAPELVERGGRRARWTRGCRERGPRPWAPRWSPRCRGSPRGRRGGDPRWGRRPAPPPLSAASERVRPSPPPSTSRTWRSVGRTPICASTFQSMSAEVITTFASESARMWATSRSPSRKITGTMTPPALEDGRRSSAVTSGQFGSITTTRSPAPTPRRRRAWASRDAVPLLVQVGVPAPLERQRDVLAVLVEALFRQVGERHRSDHQFAMSFKRLPV